MIEIGKINKYTVKRETKSGYYLQVEGEFGEVFLPPSLSKTKVEIGQVVDAFVYVDSKDQLVASTFLPYAEVGEYALLECFDVQDFGYLIWIGHLAH